MFKEAVELKLVDVAEHHRDVEAALRLYFQGIHGQSARFFGYTPFELGVELQRREIELDITSSLTLLSAIEAAFKRDFSERCKQRKRDPLSKAFRKMKGLVKAERLSLERDIFDSWKQHHPTYRDLVGQLKAAFKYRHWIAHGRYWDPPLSRNYDFASLYALADEVIQTLPWVKISD